MYNITPLFKQKESKILEGEFWEWTHEYSAEWKYLSVGGNNSTKIGTGLSLTYAYKHNFSWKVFADYDYTKKNMTMAFDPWTYFDAAIKNDILHESLKNSTPFTSVKKKYFNTFVIGAAFQINF